ncbi:unnamed protein product [marine sediment metagenome]|uniref:Uncharacterized protein n=1 Tax=marine sediment metagenome TaxID=412755 RepID=X0Y906_9ZZZZ
MLSRASTALLLAEGPSPAIVVARRRWRGGTLRRFAPQLEEQDKEAKWKYREHWKEMQRASIDGTAAAERPTAAQTTGLFVVLLLIAGGNVILDFNDRKNAPASCSSFRIWGSTLVLLVAMVLSLGVYYYTYLNSAEWTGLTITLLLLIFAAFVSGGLACV